MQTIALVNLKPGTGKTTSSVWLAHAFHAMGHRVLLVDSDPSASALEWSDLAGGFPFRVVGLPVRDLHKRVPDIARPDDVVIIDAPQLEDHAGIARSALRFVDEILIPVAPTPIEINRTASVRDEIADTEAVRVAPARSAILLNRTVSRANSTTDAREALTGLGYDVLQNTVPRLEMFAQSFGAPVPSVGGDIWRAVAGELLGRLLVAIARGDQS
jgi:chromosome partitioning protein